MRVPIPHFEDMYIQMLICLNPLLGMQETVNLNALRNELGKALCDLSVARSLGDKSDMVAASAAYAVAVSRYCAALRQDSGYAKAVGAPVFGLAA